MRPRSAVVEIHAHQAGEAAENAAALRRLDAVPHFQSGARCDNRCVDVGRAALGHMRDRLFGGRIDIDGIFACARRQPLAVDQQIMAPEVGVSVHRKAPCIEMLRG